MQDIIGVFPTAEEVRINGQDNFSLYLFEEELRSILRLIGWACSHELNAIQVDALSDQAREFLEEKGYKIWDENKTNWIEWGA